MPWSLMRRDGDVVVVRERDKKVVGRHKNRAKALRQLRALYSLEKASFGGDRSAAGRYAAEQRWKGHVKPEAIASPDTPPSGGEDVLRLMNAKPQTYTVKGVIEVGGFDLLKDITTKDEAEYEGVVLRTTVGEFRKLVKDGSLDLSDRYKEFYLDKNNGPETLTKPDSTKIGVYLSVSALPFRKQTFERVRPDEPVMQADLHSIYFPNSTASVSEDAVFSSPAEKKLVLNTSPKNQGPVTASTLRRWEKAYESDSDNTPYCDEIAKHAAHQMGELKTPPPMRDTRVGSRTPFPEMLAKDATQLLQSVNQGSPSQPVLWRGFDADSKVKTAISKAEAGDTFTLGLASTSRVLLSAHRYSDADAKTVLRIEAGSKGVDVARGGAVFVHDHEVITSGKFEVRSVETVKVPSWMLGYYAGAFASPTEKVRLQRQAVDRLKPLLKPAQVDKLEKLMTRREANARREEREQTTMKVISVTQVATYNPKTGEFENDD